MPQTKTIDINALEDVKVTFGKRVFSPKVMHCDRDNAKMKRVAVELPISETIKVKLIVFRCPKCRDEMLGIDEAKKLDRALVLNRVISSKSFTFKRKISFDGDNYTFRIPSEFTQGHINKEIKITPLESREALIKW
jgi:hypothetical protein